MASVRRALNVSGRLLASSKAVRVRFFTVSLRTRSSEDHVTPYCSASSSFCPISRIRIPTFFSPSRSTVYRVSRSMALQVAQRFRPWK